MNVSKNQKKALSLLPKGWFNDNQAKGTGVSLSTLHGLQSKSLLIHKGVGSDKEYHIKSN